MAPPLMREEEPMWDNVAVYYRLRRKAISVFT